MKKIFLLLLFVISFNKIHSQTKEFTYVSSSVSGEDYYVLIEKYNDYSTEIWVKKTEPVKYKKNKSGKAIKTGGGHSLTFVTIKCGESTYDIGESITYYENGNIKSNIDISSYENRVIPDTVMSSLYNFVCKGN